MRTVKTLLVLASLLAVSASAFTRPDHSNLITTVPFELHDNRILVSLSLEGQGPFTVIFDTGGSNVITPDVRKALGSRVLSTQDMSGAGEGTVETNAVRVGSLELGKLQMKDQDFIVLDLGAIKSAFRFEQLDGLIGYEVLQRARAKIDFDRKVIELFEPEPGRRRTASLIPFQRAECGRCASTSIGSGRPRIPAASRSALHPAPKRQTDRKCPVLQPRIFSASAVVPALRLGDAGMTHQRPAVRGFMPEVRKEILRWQGNGNPVSDCVW